MPLFISYQILIFSIRTFHNQISSNKITKSFMQKKNQFYYLHLYCPDYYLISKFKTFKLKVLRCNFKKDLMNNFSILKFKELLPFNIIGSFLEFDLMVLIVSIEHYLILI